MSFVLRKLKLKLGEIKLDIKLVDVLMELRDTSKSTEKKEILLESCKGEFGNYFKDFLAIYLDKRVSFGISYTRLQNENVDKEYIEDKSILEMLKFLKENNTGSDNTVKYIKNFILQSKFDSELLQQLFTKEWKLGLSGETVNKTLKENVVFSLKPMKSIQYPQHIHKFNNVNVTATIKLDGIRLMVLKEDEIIEMYLRSGHRIYDLNHIEEVFKTLPDGFYDGEVLISDREGLDSKTVRQRTSSVVRNEKEDKRQLEYIVFDGIDLEEYKHLQTVGTINKQIQKTYSERRSRLQQILSHQNTVNLVDSVYTGNDFTSISYNLLDKYIEQGEEGLMININDSYYKFGSVQTMAKFKKSYPIDLRVIDVYEGKSASTKGKLGGVIVKYHDNEVLVGGGWSDEERENYWKNPSEIIGKIIEIRHDGESSNSKNNLKSLSYPRKIAVRFDKDEESYN